MPNLVVPGHVVSELRGVRFFGFPFEWDMAYNNLPCTNVQAVIMTDRRGISTNHLKDTVVGQTEPWCPLPFPAFVDLEPFIIS